MVTTFAVTVLSVVVGFRSYAKVPNRGKCWYNNSNVQSPFWDIFI